MREPRAPDRCRRHHRPVRQCQIARRDRGLTAKTITVEATGGSVTSVRATDPVSGSATGGSRVTVHGDAQMDVQSTGGSTVNRG
jgi:hypothetical protein